MASGKTDEVQLYLWERYRRISGLPLNVYMVRDRRTITKLHTHDFEELLLVVNGTGSYLTPTGRYQLEQGDIFLLHPGQVHGFTNQHHLEIYNVLWRSPDLTFDFGALTSMPGYHLFFQLEPKSREKAKFRQHLHLNAEQLARAKSLIEQIQGELNTCGDGYRTMVYALLSQLFVLICRVCVNPENEKRGGLQKIAGVIQYMSEHYAKELTHAQLAKLASMSGATFSRHFRLATGESPMEYLRNLRLNQAEKLLRTTRLPLSEISDNCGFCDSNYFIMCFRQRYNITPHRYRKLFFGKGASAIPSHDAAPSLQRKDKV